MAKKDPLYPHVPKSKAPSSAWYSEAEWELAEKTMTALGILGVAEMLHRQAERLQNIISKSFPREKVDFRMDNAVDALSDVCVYLRQLDRAGW